MTNVTDAIAAGFLDPVLDAQRAFRVVLDAFSHPGHIVDLAAATRSDSRESAADPAVTALLQTLADGDTPVWLPPSLAAGPLGRFLRFHCSAPLAPTPGEAAFGVLDGGAAEPPLAAFDPGEARYPDRSCTVFISISAFERGPSVRLTGPGIETERAIAPAGLRRTFWDEVAANAARYPLGVDIILVCGTRIMGLPRTTQVALLEPV